MTSSASTQSMPIASRWRRFSCMMYEGVLLFAVVFLAGYLFDTLTQSRNALMLRHTRQLVLFVAIGVYFVLSWRYNGQTLPMKTWNVRLIDRDGGTPRAGRLMARYILLWPIPLAAALLVKGGSILTGHTSTDLLIVFAPFALFFWTFFDKDRQFLHDRILGTRLITVKTPVKPAKAVH